MIEYQELNLKKSFIVCALFCQLFCQLFLLRRSIPSCHCLPFIYLMCFIVDSCSTYYRSMVFCTCWCQIGLCCGWLQALALSLGASPEEAIEQPASSKKGKNKTNSKKGPKSAELSPFSSPTDKKKTQAPPPKAERTPVRKRQKMVSFEKQQCEVHGFHQLSSSFS